MQKKDYTCGSILVAVFFVYALVTVIIDHRLASRYRGRLPGRQQEGEDPSDRLMMLAILLKRSRLPLLLVLVGLSWVFCVNR